MNYIGIDIGGTNLKAGLKKYGSFKECHETDIGTTIGGYSGPGTIGIVFARKEK